MPGGGKNGINTIICEFALRCVVASLRRKKHLIPDRIGLRRRDRREYVVGFRGATRTSLVREEAAGARRPVVYSDVDAFWLASPLSRLRRIDAALAFSRDGVATAAGFDGKRGFALCAGFFVARPTAEAAAWLDAWRHKGRGGRASDQVAANDLYGEGVGVIADAVVDRCPRAAAPLVWHPYSPARIPGKVAFWGRVLAKLASGDGAAFAGVRCSWGGRHKGRNRRAGGGGA